MARGKSRGSSGSTLERTAESSGSMIFSTARGFSLPGPLSCASSLAEWAWGKTTQPQNESAKQENAYRHSPLNVAREPPSLRRHFLEPSSHDLSCILKEENKKQCDFICCCQSC